MNENLPAPHKILCDKNVNLKIKKATERALKGDNHGFYVKNYIKKPKKQNCVKGRKLLIRIEN